MATGGCPAQPGREDFLGPAWPRPVSGEPQSPAALALSVPLCSSWTQLSPDPLTRGAYSKKPFLCFAITLLSSVNVPNAAVSTFDLFFFLIYETCKFLKEKQNTHIHTNALLCGFRGLNFEK